MEPQCNCAKSGPFQGSGDSGPSDSNGDTNTGTQTDSATDPTTDADADSDTATNTDTDAEPQADCGGVSELSVDILEETIGLEGVSIVKTIQTVLQVSWTQETAADTVKLRFTFENDEWFESPAEPGSVGSHQIPVLGVPEQTNVTIQIVSETGGEETVCETAGTTGAVPKSMPRATVNAYKPSLASSHRWMLGSVENTPNERAAYAGPFTLYIIDRQGRIVWYYLDQAYNPAMAYPRLAPDGSHIAVERSIRAGDNQSSIFRTTLDLRQFREYTAPKLNDAMDVTDDGTFVYNSTSTVYELLEDGTERKIWSCSDWAETHVDGGWADCYANSVVFNAANNSIVLSYPYVNTVVEISRDSGEVLAYWGDATGAWTFDPSSTGLDFVHGANITEDGTLLASSHIPGSGETNSRVPHFFLEFTLDREKRIATESWRYGEDLLDWPRWKGEVFPVPNGNRLLNYGCEGVIREVTPELEVAWDIVWDADFNNELINKMVGHNILIDDLYALNKGWQEKQSR